MARSAPLGLTVALSLVLVAGCAEQENVQPATAARPQATAPAAARGAPAARASSAPASSAPALVAAPLDHLERSDVERVLRQGPPWLLRRILPEEVIREGKFVGWRMLSLPEDWRIDLKNGDIVTKVNGLSIERPDDLWDAWMQMQSAVELRMTIERDGKRRDVVIPIEGASSAGGALDKQMEAEPPPPTRPSRWQTTVIQGDDTPTPNDDGE